MPGNVSPFIPVERNQTAVHQLNALLTERITCRAQFWKSSADGFQIRDAHMSCEGYNGFQTPMSISLANDIAVTKWIFFFFYLSCIHL